MDGAGKKLFGYYPTTDVWVPLQVDANGKVVVDMSAINLNDLGDTNVPTPADDDLFYYDYATGLWKSRALTMADMPARSIVRANLQIAQVIPTDDDQLLLSYTEQIDTLSEFANASGRFTAQNAGYYLIAGSILMSSIGNHYVDIYIYINGGLTSSGRYMSGFAGNCNARVSDIKLLGVGDYVELWCWQNSGGNTFAWAIPQWSYINIYRL